MCDPVTAIVAGTVVAGGAAVAGGLQAASAAGDQRAYNQEVARLQADYRLRVMGYQNENYAKDVDFYNKQIAWEKDEFDKTKTRVTDAVSAANENFYNALSTQMTKIVQQDIAETLGVIDVQRQVQTEGGALEASLADSGISGNTANLLRGDVARQGGNAVSMIRLNASVQRDQAMLEARGLKAGRDAQLASIQIPTFAPLAPPKPPAPVSPVNPAAPVAVPSAATIALNAASAGINMGAGIGNIFQAFK
jgi:hypothetical protein